MSSKEVIRASLSISSCGFKFLFDFHFTFINDTLYSKSYSACRSDKRFDQMNIRCGPLLRQPRDRGACLEFFISQLHQILVGDCIDSVEDALNVLRIEETRDRGLPRKAAKDLTINSNTTIKRLTCE